MNLLEINHVEKAFDRLGVLKDISLTVGEGEIVSIIGPSGSGKSTLLRCATMLETMDSGEVIYLGKKAAWTGADGKAVYAGRKELREIQSQYGLVFQNFNLFPHYSVMKNITDAPIHVQKREKEDCLPGGPGAAAQNGTGGQGKRLSLPALRRTVPAGGHRQSAGVKPKDSVF